MTDCRHHAARRPHHQRAARPRVPDRHRPAQEAQRLLAQDADRAGRGLHGLRARRGRLGRRCCSRKAPTSPPGWSSTRWRRSCASAARCFPSAASIRCRCGRRIRTKPLVCAVQGICFTLGIELMLAADIVVAADDCRFAQIEVKRGIMPAGGATVRMVERAGWGNAQRYLLTGDEFGSAEALRLGFVQEVVPAGRQKERALEIARRHRRAGAAGGARLAGLVADRGRARPPRRHPRVQRPAVAADGDGGRRRRRALVHRAPQGAVQRALSAWPFRPQSTFTAGASAPWDGRLCAATSARPLPAVSNCMRGWRTWSRYTSQRPQWLRIAIPARGRCRTRSPPLRRLPASSCLMIIRYAHFSELAHRRKRSARHAVPLRRHCKAQVCVQRA